MKFIGHQKTLLKLAAVLVATNVIGVAGSLACDASTLPDGTTNPIGCGVDAAYAYAARNTQNGQSVDGTFYAATKTWYTGGYGVAYTNEDSGSPQHSMDNDIKTELIALHFNSKVALDTVTLGWSQTDADFSVFAWTNNATAPSSSNSFMIGGKKLSELDDAWQLVGNYANSASSASITKSVNAGNYVSSWWIISAYNSNFGTGSGLDNGNDYMKVLAVACKEINGGGGGQVSEPASLLMLGGGLIGMMALRRRRQKNAI